MDRKESCVSERSARGLDAKNPAKIDNWGEFLPESDPLTIAKPVDRRETQ